MIGVYVVDHERLSNETRFNHDFLTIPACQVFCKSRNAQTRLRIVLLGNKIFEFLFPHPIRRNLF
jgi:hypothetical protein